MMTDVDALAKRVERLERQNRQLKILALLVVLVVVVVALLGADKLPRTIEAQKIVLLDRKGQPKLTIGTPALTGATIDVNPDDPVIWLSDGKGADRAMLTIDGLFFADSHFKPTVSISSESKGTSGLKLYGSDGKVSWSAP
jgi:hypothetical protein